MKTVLAKWCRDNAGIDASNRLVVEFGISLLLNDYLKIMGLLLIGFISGHFATFVITLLTFGVIRTYAGGYHCKTHIGCFSNMLGICIASTWCVQFFLQIPKVAVIVILLHGTYLMICYAPRSSELNPMFEKTVLSKNRKITLFLVTVVVAISMFCSIGKIAGCVLIAFWAEAITLSPVFYKHKKRRKENV